MTNKKGVVIYDITTPFLPRSKLYFGGMCYISILMLREYSEINRPMRAMKIG